MPARHGHRGHGLVLVPACSWCDSIWPHLLPPGLGGTKCGSWRAWVTHRGAAGEQLIPPGLCGATLSAGITQLLPSWRRDRLLRKVPFQGITDNASGAALAHPGL